ncbi:MAG: winged helix-turn-helix domain-containing protein [Thermoleophilaceae bacterium]
MEAAATGQLDVNTGTVSVPDIASPGEVEVRPSEYVAIAMGHPLNLTSRELELLTALVERQGRIVSREELHRTVWGDPYRKSDRSVDVYVAKLRQKLDEVAPHRRFIHTHFGFGYRFSPEPARSHLSRLS